MKRRAGQLDRERFGAPKTKHPCVGLSRSLRNAFEQIAIGQDLGIPHKTLRKLDGLGLVVTEIENRGGFPPMKVLRAHVPIAIHMQWCQWCSEQKPEESLP